MNPFRSVVLATWLVGRVWGFAKTMRAGQTLCLMLCVGLPAAAHAVQTASTATTTGASPARQQFDRWLAAFDGNDREAYQRFMEKNFPSGSQRADRDWQVRQNTGGFDLKKATEEGPTKITVVMKERDSDMFGQVTLEVEAAEPHQIVRMEMRPVGHPAEFPVAHMSEADLIAGLRKQMDEKAAAGEICRRGAGGEGWQAGVRAGVRAGGSGKSHSEHAEDAISQRVDEQDVHGCGDVAAGAGGQAEAR